MLSSLEIGENCTIIGVKDSSVAFLQFLDSLNINIGNKVSVISKETFDNSMVIKYNNSQISISNQTSKNLFVKKL